jgi:hypothetical protein
MDSVGLDWYWRKRRLNTLHFGVYNLEKINGVPVILQVAVKLLAVD